jgi:predicted DCC family thiol-disulfide oxidoreductase YuxK
VVFYDGGCPLCRREIAHYRRRDRRQRLDWVDVTTAAGKLERHGLNFEQAMAELHVLDEAGHWQRGIDAFLVIWDHLPAYRWLVAPASTPGLKHLLAFGYQRFAAWRYRHRCSGSCSPESPASGG